MAYPSEWSRTDLGWRIFFVVVTVLITFFCIWAAISDFTAGRQDDAFAVLFALIYLLLSKVVAPYQFGWAVKRRGGNFREWALGAFVFGWLLTLIVYGARWNGRPILPEFQEPA